MAFRGRYWLVALVIGFLFAPDLASAADKVVDGSGSAIWVCLGSFAGQVFGGITVVDRKIAQHDSACKGKCNVHPA